MAERQVLDARGAFCPGPLMELIAALKLATIGEEIEVWSSDEGSISEIPEWVRKVGHELVGVNRQQGYAAIVVKKIR
jgi:tRNA 2-thiouridine synthesizing protein A